MRRISEKLSRCKQERLSDGFVTIMQRRGHMPASLPLRPMTFPCESGSDCSFGSFGPLFCCLRCPVTPAYPPAPPATCDAPGFRIAPPGSLLSEMAGCLSLPAGTLCYRQCPVSRSARSGCPLLRRPVFAAAQSPFFRQSFDISSRVLPLVSGTHFQTKSADASAIRA